MIKIKKIYEEYSKEDGYRILVDRLWPRGISKEKAKIDLWIKEITPSNNLRKWYHDNLEEQEKFKIKYSEEILQNSDSLKEIKDIIKEEKTITLVSASKDPKPLHSVILKQKLAE